CLEEIVEVTGHGMGLEDGESLPHQVGEALGVALGMAVKLDMDESGEREAEGSGIELGAISFDEPGTLQGLAAPRRLGLRKANFLCEVGTAQRAVALKSVEQTQIVAVESLHVLEHSTADDARKRANKLQSAFMLRDFCSRADIYSAYREEESRPWALFHMMRRRPRSPPPIRWAPTA